MSWYVVSVAMRTKTKKTCVVKRVEHVLNNGRNLRGGRGGGTNVTTQRMQKSSF